VSTAIAPPTHPVDPARIRPAVTRWHTLPSARWAAAALTLFLLGLAARTLDAPEPLVWALFSGCYLTGGWEPGLEGLRALGRRTLDVDLLMVVAAIGAAAIGQILDGALLIVIFATSGALEDLATTRTEDSVRGLLDLAPQTALRLGPDGQDRVATTDLLVGQEILVRPGERVGADGQVVSGRSDVDQASVTGESLPTERGPGDQVFAGTLNGSGVLRVRVTRPARESVVARIAALVEEASRVKGTTQLLVEKIEQRYSIAMVGATGALFVVPLLFGDSLRDALLRAMTFMIVASPCAIVLSSMPPLLAAVANAGRHGVLVKSAVAIEHLAGTDRVAFDKTGTLTEGSPVLAALHRLDRPVDPDEPTDTADTADTDELLALAAAVEYGSEHPLARAVLRRAAERGIEVPTATDFVARPGAGVRALVEGRAVRLDAPETDGGMDPALAERIRRAGAGGRTVAVLHVDDEPRALLGFTDQVRPDAATAVAAVERATGRAPILLTGDNPDAAGSVAALTGIAEVRADLLPADKVAELTRRQAAGERITFVGDGVNDAPALAVADCGIAMGAGADLSLQTADAVVVGQDLRAVAAVIELSRRARQVVLANLVIAAVCILGLVAWDLFGELPLPLGVAGHEGSTVLVGLNGLRLLRERAWVGSTRTADRSGQTFG